MGIWGRADSDNCISEVPNSYPHCWAVLTSELLCVPRIGEVRKMFSLCWPSAQGLSELFFRSQALPQLSAFIPQSEQPCIQNSFLYKNEILVLSFAWINSIAPFFFNPDDFEKVSCSTLILLLVSEWLLRSLSVSHMVAEHDFRHKFGKTDSDLFMFSSVLRLLKIFFGLT